MKRVVSAFDAIDVAGAKASAPEDEAHVKALIQRSSSFESVNTRVRDHLADVVKDEVGDSQP